MRISPVKMMMLSFAISACAAVASASGAPVLQWARYLHVNAAAGAAMIISTHSGTEYAVAGSCGATDCDTQPDRIFLVKTDLFGNVRGVAGLFNTFTMENGGTNDLGSILEAGNGDIILVGTRTYNTHFNHSTNAWVMRIAANGTILWKTAFGSSQGDLYTARCGTLLKTGDIVIAGRNAGNAWAGCVGGDGAVKWTGTYSGEDVVSLAQFENSHCPDFYATCISNNGSVATLFMNFASWYDGSLMSSASGVISDVDGAAPVILTASDSAKDMNTIVAERDTVDNTCRVQLYDRQASLEWQHVVRFGNGGGISVTAVSSFGTDDWLVAGSGNRGGTDIPQDMWMSCLNASGIEEWQWTFSDAQMVYALLASGNHEFIGLVRNNNRKDNLAIMKFDVEEEQLPAISFAGQAAKNGMAGAKSTAAFDVQGRLVSKTRAGQIAKGMYFGRTRIEGTTAAPGPRFLQK